MYPPHHHGGYELVWHGAVRHLRAHGHDVQVVTTDYRTGTASPDDPGVHRELRWPFREGDFERLSPRAVRAMTRHNHRVMSRRLASFRPEVVAWWSMGGLSLTLIEAVRRRGVVAVAFVHDEWLDYGRFADPWLRLFTGPRRGRLARVGERLGRLPASVDFARAAEYVFVSDFTRRHALGLGLGPLRTDVAHSGIHADFLHPGPEREWRWRLLYVGRLDPRKGVDTAVEALAQLPDSATLTIVGGWNDRERNRLSARARELGVADRVAFEGERDRTGLIAAYEAADAVVFPVRWNEPWGLVPLEAMAKRRPVVATGRGGSAEYLRDGENCLLFPVDDAGALAAAVRRLATEPELRSRLCEGGLRTAPLYTEARFNEAVEAALSTAVARRRTSASATATTPTAANITRKGSAGAR